MPLYIAVQGTHERRPPIWSDADSPLSVFLAQYGLENAAKRAALKYAWSADLDLNAGDDWDWVAGGQALFYYVVPPLTPELRLPPADTVVIGHSHALQVVAYAAKFGLKIDRFLDVAGPVRHDMMQVYGEAKKNIRQWLHIHSDCSDRWQWLGEMFDGHLGIVRKHPMATWNIGIPRVGHTGILNEPKHFHFWEDLDLIGFLNGNWKGPDDGGRSTDSPL